ncbi:hypothetical protein RYX36_024986, partial [Vicia faba]
IMDTHEYQTIYLKIQEFYEDLHVKKEQQILMLLVERQALNEPLCFELFMHTIDWKKYILN